jgi:hypothetical protein
VEADHHLVVAVQVDIDLLYLVKHLEVAQQLKASYS